MRPHTRHLGLMVCSSAIAHIGMGQGARPAPPTRDPHTPGYVTATELPDGRVPSIDIEGNFVIGPTHTPAPEMIVKDGVLHGTVSTFTMSSADSKIYPGVGRDSGTFGVPDPRDPATLVVTTSHPAPYTRRVAVYVPAQYVPGTVAPFIVGADGPDALLFTALDNLIAEKRVPVMIAISIGNGSGDAQGSERGLEYDTMSGRYAEWVESEVLPLVEKRYAVRLTKNPDGRFVLAADLGADRVFVYRLDLDGKSLHHVEGGDAVMRPGAGPRHIAFHPTLPLVFVANELDSTVATLRFDAERGALSPLETHSTVPAGWSATNYPADIHVASTGRTVYVSNRGHNSIAVFSVAESTGALALDQVVSTEGDWPRNFSLDPTGRWLLVANQRSDSVVVFGRDPEHGTLTRTRQRIAIPSPVCVRSASGSWRSRSVIELELLTGSLSSHPFPAERGD